MSSSASGVFGGPAPDPNRQRTFIPRRSEHPRKVRGGMKLAGVMHAAVADAAKAERWSEAGIHFARSLLMRLQPQFAPADHEAGMEYARIGQVVDVDVQSGRIEGRVQGRAPRPYITKLHLPTFDDGQWERVIEVMSLEAMHAAKLLTGELPAMLRERLDSADLSLTPTQSEQVRPSCTCTPMSNGLGAEIWCKHVAAMLQIAAERIAEHPLLMFTWRGRSPEQLLEHVRQARMLDQHEKMDMRPTGAIAQLQHVALPLEACIDEFWKSPLSATDWAQAEQSSTVHFASHALLRRLGPSPLSGKFPMVGLLASIYDTAADRAARLRQSETEA